MRGTSVIILWPCAVTPALWDVGAQERRERLEPQVFAQSLVVDDSASAQSSPGALCFSVLWYGGGGMKSEWVGEGARDLTFVGLHRVSQDEHHAEFSGAGN